MPAQGRRRPCGATGNMHGNRRTGKGEYARGGPAGSQSRYGLHHCNSRMPSGAQTNTHPTDGVTTGVLACFIFVTIA